MQGFFVFILWAERPHFCAEVLILREGRKLFLQNVDVLDLLLCIKNY